MVTELRENSAWLRLVVLSKTGPFSAGQKPLYFNQDDNKYNSLVKQEEQRWQIRIVRGFEKFLPALA